jgi:hypothetical protein
LESALDAVPAAETTSEDGVPPPPSR